VFVAEWLRTSDASRAWASMRATAVGVLQGATVQFGAGLVGVGIWAVAAVMW